MLGSFIRATALFAAVLVTGCAANLQLPPSAGPKIAVSPAAAKQLVLVVDGSKTAKDSKDWEQFRSEWRTAITEAGTAAKLDVRYQDSAPATASPAVLARVYINDYRYVTQGARYAAGIMTGNAFVDADVSFSELPGNTPAGTRKYNTSSSAGQGIFSPMTEKQVRAVCDAIVGEVAQR